MRVYTQKICGRMFTAALFIRAKTWEQPKYPSIGKPINCGVIINGTQSSNKKELITNTYNSMDES